MLKRVSPITLVGIIVITLCVVSLILTDMRQANSETSDTPVTEQTDSWEPEHVTINEPLPSEDGEIGEGLVEDSDEPADTPPVDSGSYVDEDGSTVHWEVHEFPSDYDGGIIEDDEPPVCE